MLQRPGVVQPVRLTPVVGLLLLAACGSATAQQLTLNDGMEALRQAYHKNRELIGSLLKADTIMDPSRAEQVDAIAVEARLATYPLVYASEVNPTQAGAIDSHFRKTFENDLSNIQRYKVKNPELGKVYAEQVQKFALEVYAHNPNNVKPVIRINVARMLSQLAQFGRPELADALLMLLEDPPPRGNDAVRYWALHGLRDLLGQADQIGAPVVNPERIEKVATALVGFLEKVPSFAQTAPADEIEGYKLLRREAVRALAQVRQPQVNPKARPAAMLTRFVGDDVRLQARARAEEAPDAGDVAGGDLGDAGGDAGADNPRAGRGGMGRGGRGGMGRGGRGGMGRGGRGGMGRGGRGSAGLGARMDERLEAAIGLARMHPGKESPGYQADYVAEQIGHFVALLGARANDNYTAPNREREQPWRIDAARLADAMEEMKKTEAKDAFVVQVADAALRVLRAVERGVQAPAAELTFLGDCAAPDREVFKGHRDTAVQAAAAGPGGGGFGRRGGRGGGGSDR
jgi:hypothetical protein